MNVILRFLANGKTLAGAVLTAASMVGAYLTPDDLAALQAVLAGTNTAGQWVLVVGLAHRLYKYIQAKRS